MYHKSIVYYLKPGLHISCKDRKHMAANTFLRFSHMPWSSHSCNDHRYSYFTRNFCNRCINILKILFGATSEACSAIVTTIWRPGLQDLQGFQGFADLTPHQGTTQDLLSLDILPYHDTIRFPPKRKSDSLLFLLPQVLLFPLIRT